MSQHHECDFERQLENLRPPCMKLGEWLAAALDDEEVSQNMRDAITEWFAAFPEDWWAKRADES